MPHWVVIAQIRIFVLIQYTFAPIPLLILEFVYFSHSLPLIGLRNILETPAWRHRTDISWLVLSNDILLGIVCFILANNASAVIAVSHKLVDSFNFWLAPLSGDMAFGFIEWPLLGQDLLISLGLPRENWLLYVWEQFVSSHLVLAEINVDYALRVVFL